MKTKTTKTRFKRTNPNPRPLNQWDQPKGDCSIRGVANALEISWEEAYKKLAEKGLEMYDLMSSGEVIRAVLWENGFQYDGGRGGMGCGYAAENVGMFADKNRKGTFVIECGGDHLTVVKNGKILDEYDCSRYRVDCVHKLIEKK